MWKPNGIRFLRLISVRIKPKTYVCFVVLYMMSSLVSNIQTFMENEKITMKLQEASDSGFWLESQDGFMATKFVVDEKTHEILYDIFSPQYDVHLKEETLRDVERLDFISEAADRGLYEKSIEDFWLIMDAVKLWAENNGFATKETSLI